MFSTSFKNLRQSIEWSLQGDCTLSCHKLTAQHTYNLRDLAASRAPKNITVVVSKLVFHVKWGSAQIVARLAATSIVGWSLLTLLAGRPVHMLRFRLQLSALNWLYTYLRSFISYGVIMGYPENPLARLLIKVASQWCEIYNCLMHDMQIFCSFYQEPTWKIRALWLHSA